MQPRSVSISPLVRHLAESLRSNSRLSHSVLARHLAENLRGDSRVSRSVLAYSWTKTLKVRKLGFVKNVRLCVACCRLPGRSTLITTFRRNFRWFLRRDRYS